ncbi:hypothetical protein FRC02_009472 [Tulasnella sp. 418]|nr:hypothetical protein FRC02_009472 [Tulasnella sp. 418]
MADTLEPQATVDSKRLWYRSTVVQAVITGGVAFTAPGMWNALNTLGAAGAAEPYLLNAANSLVFGLMGFLSILGGAVIAKLGLKRTLVLGSIGWPLYSASLYTNNRYGNEWFVLVGATTCGLSAGLFWASEGAIILGYPEPTKRGRYLSIWVAFRNAGPIVGGIINLALNYHRKTAGKVGYETYYAMIAIMCLGLPISLLLTPPEKVQRNDGSKVKVVAAQSWSQEIKAVGRLFRTKRTLLMLPVYFSSYFYWGYQSTFTTLNFTIRARALSSLVTQFSGILASILVGLLVDQQRISKRSRARWGFLVSSVLCVATWIWAFIIQDIYAESGPPKLDWTHKY